MVRLLPPQGASETLIAPGPLFGEQTKAEAINFLNEAEEFGRGEERQVGPVMIRHTRCAFSMWRYRFVSVEQFFDDCRLMRRMIQGEPLRPAFLGPPPAGTQV
jgi:hypothetical protein